MSTLSNVCMLPATNTKPVNLTHGQATDVAQPESLCLCVFFLILISIVQRQKLCILPVFLLCGAWFARTGGYDLLVGQFSFACAIQRTGQFETVFNS